MKKILVFLLLLLGVFKAKPQALINGDFSINTGNDITIPGCTFSNTTFSDGSASNWVRSHGSPHFGCTSCFIGPDALTMGAIFVGSTGDPTYDSTDRGDGIMGEYYFIPGNSYRVEVDVIQADLRDGAFNIYAAYNISRNLSSALPLYSTPCASFIPTAASKILIGSISGVYFSSPITTSTFDITIPLGTNYDRIWLYPTDSTVSGHNSLISIDAVRIGHICDNSKYFISGVVTAGNYQNYRHISAGSSLPGGGTNVQIDPSHSTKFIAGEDIRLVNNFEATVSTGNVFIAEINPCDLSSGFKSNSGLASVKNNQGNTHEPISLYPNPNDGTFDITLPNTDGYDITITNVVGSVVYQTKVSGAIKQNIRMQDAAPGNYFVTISNEQLKEVRQIVISK